METRVTVLVVAHSSADRLRRTLAAVEAQTRTPDRVIGVAVDAKDEILRAFDDGRVDQVVTTTENLSFGRAIAAGLRVVDEPVGDDEYLWFLAQDTAPEPTALAELLAGVEVAPSVAVAGPKVVDADDPRRIRSLGETMTTLGRTVELVTDELDQGQHDGETDVLAVSPIGMLVRAKVFEDLGGFDAALGPVDDGLDFGVRVRLAGSRVTLVPEAVVGSAGDGVAGAPRGRRWGTTQRRARLARSAELHRRLVYAPAALLPLHWLSILPLAVLRSIALLVLKRPGLVGSEFRAAFKAAFADTRVFAARSNLSRSRRVGWSTISGLRMPWRELRRRRELEREVEGDDQAFVERTDLRFFGGGGAWLVLGSAVVGLVLLLPLVPATVLDGGGLLPMSRSVSELWANVGWGWRDVGTGFVGASDPFTVVVAVLGTLTFWDPSFSLVLLWLLAFPLATLGGWLAATRLTERSGFRLVGAVLWTLSPTFLAALADGRPAAVIVHLVLPWLFLAGTSAARSWASAAASSILLAVVAACSPVLAVPLAILWLFALVSAGRGVLRVLLVPVPTLVLFAPLIWQQGVVSSRWTALLADPGAGVATSAVGPASILSGFPIDRDSTWSALATAWGVSGNVLAVVLPVLLVPMALLALAGLFVRGQRRTLVLLAVALLGAGTAVAAGSLTIATLDGVPISVWQGSALSLYWLGLSGAALSGLDGLGRRGVVPALVAVVGLAVMVAPLAAAKPFDTSVVVAGSGRTLPAYVDAAATEDPDIATLRITPLADGSIAVRYLAGRGDLLDDQSTVSRTSDPTAQTDARVAELAGNLVSRSGLDAAPELAALGIDFVLLSTEPFEVAELADEAGSGEPDTDARRGPDELAADAAAALTANPAVEYVGPTDAGELWRNVADVERPQREGVDPLWSTIVPVSWIVVFLIALLIAVPTAASREAARRRSRTVGIRPASRRRAAPDEDDAAAIETLPDLVEPADGQSDPDWADDAVSADGAGADGADADAVGDSVSGDSSGDSDGPSIDELESGVSADPIDAPDGEAGPDDGRDASAPRTGGAR
ncbi:GT2 family glycosyltransferase [Labedella gwakjiensis]|uniref:GT2 family glycosyltransferase n=1 Tax=Labedella gwakjiensis TaxID=390269 RepID=A0A2P8GXY9_9MICO|nr:glycosyltransferase family 2 protein [Labedella gwakjiensis]PSL38805.1 GT2 family glycosyltransferase [Labedella gwakjiensis]RUQ86724.1 glycosyltransferase family 2 protein [Labedella gwakjiensis]